MVVKCDNASCLGSRSKDQLASNKLKQPSKQGGTAFDGP